MNKLSKNTKLSLQQLSQRLVILLCLLPGEKNQTIKKLSIDHMSLNNDKCTFSVPEIKNVASRVPQTIICHFNLG